MRHAMPWSMGAHGAHGIHRARNRGPCNDFIEEDHISGILLGSVDATTSARESLAIKGPMQKPRCFSYGNVAISLKWEKRWFSGCTNF